MKDDKEIYDYENAGEENSYVPGVEQPRLSRNDERNSDIHWVAHVAVQAFNHQSFRRCNRSGSSAPDEGEAPESRPEINRDPDGDQADRRPLTNARNWQRPSRSRQGT